MMFAIAYFANQSFIMNYIEARHLPVSADLFFMFYAVALLVLRLGLRDLFDSKGFHFWLTVCSLGMLATLAICAVQPEFTLQQVLIEVFSAIDTVGLTTGITRDLNTFSRIVIIMLMYAGRLGSMTFIILLTRRKPPAPVQYPTDKVVIG